MSGPVLVVRSLRSRVFPLGALLRLTIWRLSRRWVDVRERSFRMPYLAFLPILVQPLLRLQYTNGDRAKLEMGL